MDNTYNTEKVSGKNEIARAVSKRKRNLLLKKKIYEKGYKLLLILIGLLILVYIVFFSPIFAIREIEVNGLNNVEKYELKENLYSIKGSNFFATDLSELRLEMVEDFVFIEHVYTEKAFPNKVVIKITEREPLLIADSHKGCFLVDAQGYVLLPEEWGCGSLEELYDVYNIYGTDIDDITFEYSEKSDFYNLEKIEDITNVLDYYDYEIKEMKLEGQVLDVYLSEDRKLTFYILDEVDILLKRFIVIHKQLEIEDIGFESIDFRYERPVMVEE